MDTFSVSGVAGDFDKAGQRRKKSRSATHAFIIATAVPPQCSMGWPVAGIKLHIAWKRRQIKDLGWPLHVRKSAATVPGH